jgi:hypothetical protein
MALGVQCNCVCVAFVMDFVPRVQCASAHQYFATQLSHACPTSASDAFETAQARLLAIQKVLQDILFW